MAKAVGLPQNSYCLFAKVRASLPDSTGVLSNPQMSLKEVGKRKWE